MIQEDPFSGIPEIGYYPAFLNAKEASELFKGLLDMKDRATGKLEMYDGESYKLETPKLTFLEAGLEKETTFTPRLWGRSESWPTILKSVKLRIESMLGQVFHVGVMLYYPNGSTISSYHSDPSYYGNNDFIPSLSFGATRTFAIKHSKSGIEHKVQFQSGDLIVMKPGCQELYQHAILEDPGIEETRINITLRKFGY